MRSLHAVAGLCLLVLPGLALSAGPTAKGGGFVTGGLTSSSLNIQDSSGFDMDAEGGGFFLEGGAHFHPGIMVRVGYRGEVHDDNEACFGGGGCTQFNDDFERDQFRLGVFYAPGFGKRKFTYRVGGGLHYHEFTIPAASADTEFVGVFIESGAVFRPGRVVDLDLGVRLLVLSGDEDDGYDSGGGFEFGAGATFHAGPVDLGLRLEASGIVMDFVGGGDEDQGQGLLMFTIGGAWGYAN